MAFYAKAQQIEGRVTDQNGEPLTGASVYIDGTTQGDVTDLSGQFTFDFKPRLNAILVVSFVGYKKVYVNNPQVEQPYLFKLEEDVSVMGEVVVYSIPFNRKQMMKAFKAQFIGSKALQRKCAILNESDIKFRYNPQTLTFTAQTEKPIELRNEYLGYKVKYDLISFEIKYRNFSLNNEEIKFSVFSGTTQFDTLVGNNKIEKRRLKAYENSTMSFFRALKNDKLKENGYQLYFKRFPVAPSRIMRFENVDNITKVKVEKQINGLNPKGFVAKLDILYKKNKRSSVTFFTTNFFIDQYGMYSNFNEILFSGEIATKKMALILPADYGLE